MIGSFILAGITPVATPQNLLSVHFLDVGQSDCTLVITPAGSTMLIDSGKNKDFKNVISYLEKNNVYGIDILVGTHPDADHIAALDDLIDKYKEFDKIYLPLVAKDTNIFRKVIETILKTGEEITPALGGFEIPFDPKIRLEILAPNSMVYDDANEYSVVIKLTYGEMEFIFTGDAGHESEIEMLEKGYNLVAEVLKAGHHGSKTSTSKEFLLAVNPEFAVISAGKDNRYGHPSSEILELLESNEVKLLRTDELGTIVLYSDGATITRFKETLLTSPLEITETSTPARISPPTISPTPTEITPSATVVLH